MQVNPRLLVYQIRVNSKPYMIRRFADDGAAK